MSEGFWFDEEQATRYVDLIRRFIPRFELTAEAEQVLRTAFGWRTADNKPAILSSNLKGCITAAGGSGNSLTNTGAAAPEREHGNA